MTSAAPTRASLERELATARAERDEAQETPRAILDGEADAIVTPGPKGGQPFSRNESDHPYRVLVEAMSDGAAMLIAGHIAYCNSRFAQIVGIPLDQIIGSSLDRLTPERRSALEALVANAMTCPSTAEMTFVAADGTTVPTVASACSMDLDGTPAICLVVSDVSARLRAEEALRRSEERFQNIVETTNDWMWETDAEGRFTYSSPQVTKLLGADPAEILGKSPTEFVVPEERGPLGAFIRGRRERPRPVHGVTATYVARDGRKGVVEVSLVPMFDPRGTFLGDRGISRDITADKQLKTLRQNRESELREAQRIAGIGSWEWAIATGTVTWSEGLNRILARGLDLPAPTFEALASFYTPESWERLGAAIATTIETGAPYELELEMVRADGTTCWTTTRGEGWRGPEGAVVMLRGTVHNIDGRKRAERAVHQEKEFNQAVVDSLPGLFYLIDAHSHLLQWNKNLEKVSGYSAEELSGISVLNFFNEPDKGLIAEGMRQVFSAGEALVKGSFVAKDQTETPYLFSGRQFLFDGKRCLVGLGIDVTSQQRAEKDLRLQSAAFNAAAQAMVITDRNGVIAWLNPAFTELTGYSADEAIGINPRALLKSGAEDQAFYTHLWDTILAGNIWRGEMINRRKDGSQYPEEQTITPVKDPSGEITHFIAAKRDLTEQRRWEAQFLQAQKMEALGTLAGGIAHDFNNILGAMLGCTEMATMDAGGNQAVLKNLAQVTAAGRRATDLVQHILAFSGQQAQARQSIHLDSVVREALALLLASLPASVELRSTFDPAAPAVLADPTQVHQIVMNLGINAWHAMKDRPGVIDVTLDVVNADAKLVGDRTGRYVRLSVRDTGHGMDPATQARVFEPFFTTKAPGEGTGLGLASVHGIIKSYGGKISVSSQVGEGTTFQLYFPAIELAVADVDVGEAPVPSGNGQHILFVDDERSLVAWGTGALERLGYRVTGQSSVVDALAAVTEDAHDFDLVVTDLTMPVMTGIQFAQRVRAVRPDLPVILTTGYAAMTIQAVRQLGIDTLLVKPIASKTLAEAVHRVLREEE